MSSAEGGHRSLGGLAAVPASPLVEGVEGDTGLGRGGQPDQHPRYQGGDSQADELAHWFLLSLS
jgi:hypothetical protein